MKAVVTQDYDYFEEVPKGTIIEIVGFVYHSFFIQAIYVDQFGGFAEIPVNLLRVEQSVGVEAGPC